MSCFRTFWCLPISLLVGACILGGCTLFPGGEEKPSVSSAKPSNPANPPSKSHTYPGVTLSVTVHAWKIESGKVLYPCRFELRNLSGKEIRFKLPRPWVVSLKTPSGEIYDAEPEGLPGSEEPVFLPHAKSVRGTIFDLAEFFPMEEKGTYRLRVSWRDGKGGEVSSPWRTFSSGE